ncbi:MAG TPA: DUF2577 family protein, partial [Bacilli bacterium]|nr:DUF2577 family protein [Bacilli bacterium]
MALIDHLKQIVADTTEASNPVAVLMATVSQTHPLAVRVDQRFELSEDFLIQTEATMELTFTVDGVEKIIRRGLKVGDTVALLRV